MKRAGSMIARAEAILDHLRSREKHDPGNIYAILTTVKKFIAREMPTIMGVNPDANIHVEMPLKGKNSIVLFVTAEKKKALLRAYPLADSPKADRHLYAINLLAGHGVRVPRVLATNGAVNYSARFIVEQFIEGNTRHSQQLTPDNVKSMAVQLAKLHSIHLEKWGPLQNERSDDFFASVLRSINRQLLILLKANLITSTESTAVQDWFVKQQPLFQATSTYSLTHNDLHPANGIYEGSSSFVLIDLDKLYWGHAARELQHAYFRLLRQNPDNVALFNESYFAGMTQSAAAITQSLLIPYEAEFRLSSAVRYLDRVSRERDRHKPHLERAKTAAAAMLEVISR